MSFQSAMKAAMDATEEARNRRDEILEQFALAYLMDTGARPSEVEMVLDFEPADPKQGASMKQVIYFRKRTVYLTPQERSDEASGNGSL